MNKEEVTKLAALARIGIEEAEAEKLSHEFETILAYVAEVKKISNPALGEATQDKNDYILKNIMREDGEPHESGAYTDKLLAEAPERSGNLVKVKNIL